MGVSDEEGQPVYKRPKLELNNCSIPPSNSCLPPVSPFFLPRPADQKAGFTEPAAVHLVASMAGKGTSVASTSRIMDTDRVGSQNQIRKGEFVRLITQALYSLGYPAAAACLEEESQVALQTEPVKDFRSGVLEGRWDACVELLADMHLDEDDFKNAKFLILQQKFLELLEDGHMGQALRVLRAELAPLGIHTKRLHKLAGWVMCTTPDDLKLKAHWTGAAGDSRYQLLVDLQGLLPPSIMIPERRLENLIEQALAVQMSQCVYHNTVDQAFCLFADHSCGRDKIPSETTQILETHTDEVWYLQFSHDGTRLASASKDQTVIIWEVGNGENGRVQHVLTGHNKALSFVAWSPDDTRLLTAGNYEVVKLWDTATGHCLRTYEQHSAAVTSCAWLPDSRSFVSGGLDKCIYMWDLEGNELESWKGPEMPRINDLAVSEDGKLMVSICNEKEIRIFSLQDRSQLTINESNSLTSLAMSSDGRCLLVNLSSGHIHLWDKIDPKAPASDPACKYEGHKQGRFVIRSCFGGSEQAFIASGSEDSQVYIWHRATSELLEVLPGHSGTVNAVSWNPTNPHMFASASDDKTVRLWGLKKSRRKLEPPAVPNGNMANGTKPAENGVSR